MSRRWCVIQTRAGHAYAVLHNDIAPPIHKEDRALGGTVLDAFELKPEWREITPHGALREWERDRAADIRLQHAPAAKEKTGVDYDQSWRGWDLKVREPAYSPTQLFKRLLLALKRRKVRKKNARRRRKG